MPKRKFCLCLYMWKTSLQFQVYSVSGVRTVGGLFLKLEVPKPSKTVSRRPCTGVYGSDRGVNAFRSLFSYGPRALSFSFVYTTLNCHLLPLPLLSPPSPLTPQLWATQWGQFYPTVLNLANWWENRNFFIPYFHHLNNEKKKSSMHLDDFSLNI